MAEQPGVEQAVRADSRYKQGMISLQAGQWAEAVSAFESLAQDYPASGLVKRLLAEARFKAEFDTTNKVTPKSTVDRRKLLVRGALVVAVALLIWRGVPVVQGQILPAIAQAQEARRVESLRTQALGLYERGKYAEAVAALGEYLALRPGDAEAQAAYEEASKRVEVRSLYDEAVALQERGNYEAALAKFNEVEERVPDFLDVRSRIAAIERSLEIEDLFTSAEANRQAGLYKEALAQYEQIRQLNISYRRETVTSRLYELYLTLGRELVSGWPAERSDLEQALDYFAEALSIRPRDPEVLRERQLLTWYLDGEDRYYEGRWDEAVAMWAKLYAEAPDYLEGHVAELLYDAYVRSGDQHSLAGDYYYAHEQYRLASLLPVADTSKALEGMATIDAMLLPTPTPTPTRLPTPVVTRVAGGPAPAATATPTPATLLGSYTGKIAFYSDNPKQPGIWVMDPNGQNRQYVGNSQDLHAQFNALAERARLSPGGEERLFVRNVGDIAQIFVAGPSGERQLTHLDGLCYDPVWSPDGSRISFVSQHTGSDDIWVMNANGSGAKNLTEEDPEHRAWDKHPAWSPDGQEIAFWSSRTGLRQVHIMAADGSNVRNISNTPWDEYDPIWIR